MFLFRWTIDRKMDDPTAPELIVPAAGVHVMFPAHFSPARMGLIVPKTTDGRYDTPCDFGKKDIRLRKKTTSRTDVPSHSGIEE